MPQTAAVGRRRRQGSRALRPGGNERIPKRCGDDPCLGDAAGGAHGSIAVYSSVYARMCLVGGAVSLVFLLAAPWVRKLMQGVH